MWPFNKSQEPIDTILDIWGKLADTDPERFNYSHGRYWHIVDSVTKFKFNARYSGDFNPGEVNYSGDFDQTLSFWQRGRCKKIRKKIIHNKRQKMILKAYDATAEATTEFKNLVREAKIRKKYPMVADAYKSYRTALDLHRDFKEGKEVDPE